MQRTMFALAAAALVTAALPFQTQAHCRGCGVAAGVVGGLAAGAIIGSAIASQPPVYGAAPVYGAVPPADYVAPPPGDPNSPEYIEGASCHIERQQVWDGMRYRPRDVEMCE
jgi:hypothetical protein